MLLCYMRLSVFVIAGLAILIALSLSPTRAYEMPYDPYSWCAVYGGSMSGSSNCGFTTWQQCMATVSGVGGSCEANQFYNPHGSVRHSKSSRKRPSYSRHHDQLVAPFSNSSGSWPSYFYGD